MSSYGLQQRLLGSHWRLTAMLHVKGNFASWKLSFPVFSIKWHRDTAWSSLDLTLPLSAANSSAASPQELLWFFFNNTEQLLQEPQSPMTRKMETAQSVCLRCSWILVIRIDKHVERLKDGLRVIYDSLLTSKHTFAFLISLTSDSVRSVCLEHHSASFSKTLQKLTHHMAGCLFPSVLSTAMAND